MKFGQFMSYYKRKNIIKKFYKNCGLKTSSRPFVFAKMEHNFYWLMKFLEQATLIFFKEDSLKIRKGLELVSKPYFSQNLNKKIFCNIAYTGQISLPD